MLGILKENKINIILHVKVKPNARKEELVWEDNHWLLSITSPPEDGKANTQLITFLSKKWKISKSSITIIKGHHIRFKTLSIDIEEGKWSEIMNDK